MATLNSHLTGYNTCCPRGYSAFWAAGNVGGGPSASVRDRSLNLKRGGTPLRSQSRQVLLTSWHFLKPEESSVLPLPWIICQDVPVGLGVACLGILEWNLFY